MSPSCFRRAKPNFRFLAEGIFGGSVGMPRNQLTEYPHLYARAATLGLGLSVSLSSLCSWKPYP